MLNVFITVDTEAYPRTADWQKTCLAKEIEREVFGLTPQGEFGIRFMADCLNSYGLKGVFFVESLFACAVGLAPLQSIVTALTDRKQDVQLHLHPEWLQLAQLPLLEGRVGYNLKDFSEQDQVELISLGRRNLIQSGAPQIRAFRTGNFGADMATMRALAQTGIVIDSSYEACALERDCGMAAAGLLLQPKKLEGVYEFPVAFFEDRPGHRRPAQICACSNAELEHILLQAWNAKWHSVVLLTHSFELVNNRKNHDRPCTPSRILVSRFEKLCQFLAAHSDKFRTSHFADFNDLAVPVPVPETPLHSSFHHTVLRYGEQFASRFF